MTGLDFLTDVGTISTDLRREMILLSDTLGLSALVDSIDHPRTGKSTEGTVLGPFHTHDAREVENGYAIHKDPDGTPLLVLCTVKDTEGNPLEGVQVDVWEGDSHGNYDVQYADRDGPEESCFPSRMEVSGSKRSSQCHTRYQWMGRYLACSKCWAGIQTDQAMFTSC
jgi:protocatechuate 3,4-dioxygenase beta subunit